MNIDITGVGLANRGAELMLAAILQHYEPCRGNVRFSTSPSNGSFTDRARYGLYQHFDIRHSGRMGRLLQKMLHRGYRDRFGLVTEDEIDVVLDASGFAVGDQWPARWIENRASRYRHLREAGKKIVMLPQAFGPFAKAEVRGASRRWVEACTLVFARDDYSLQHLRELGIDPKILHLAPDFTLALQPSLTGAPKLAANAAAIVPNAQMFAGERAHNRDRYLTFLASAVTACRDQGFVPHLVLFERNMDRQFCEELAKRFEISIIDEPDLSRLKALIGSLAVVIGSRFHALLTALSSGVPALGTGWSHKYAALFADYGHPEWLLGLDADAEEIGSVIEAIEAERNAVELGLRHCAVRISSQIEAMWDEVDAVLGLAGQRSDAA